MALLKPIELDNGIVLNYHRIVSINKITNNTIIIEVGSYISEEKRQDEINYYNCPDVDKSLSLYINTTYLNKEYSETETITDLYEYLKTTEMFIDAEDV